MNVEVPFESMPDGSLGPFTLRFYESLFTGRFFLPSLYNTMIYSLGSAVIAIVIGTVQALIVERTNTPGRNLAFFAAILSLGVPHILYTVAWLLIPVLWTLGAALLFFAWRYFRLITRPRP